MALSRVFIPFLKTSTEHLKVGVFFLKSHDIMAFAVRHRSTVDITKNLCLITAANKKIKIKNLQLEQPIDKPLVVLLSWLMAKRKHIYKFADFYLEKGFDVLNVNITPWQLLWPVKGSQDINNSVNRKQDFTFNTVTDYLSLLLDSSNAVYQFTTLALQPHVVASDVLKFLDKNTAYNPLLIHAFSVGGYVWGEVLVQIAAAQHRYQHIIDRTTGQVYDSAADITELPTGLPFAVFPKNPVLQSTLRQYIIYHLRTFDKVATCHYLRASQIFHSNIIRAPALFFLSKNDPIGSERSNLKVRENWEKMNIPVYWKCWENSPHVLHFQAHREEYIDELSRLLQDINVSESESPQRMQAKL